MKSYEMFLCFLCVWNAQHCKLINNDISEEFYSCDYTRFDNQLERLKLQAEVNHETQLSRQDELFRKMDRKINDLSHQIEGIQDKLLEVNKINIENLKNFILGETQPKVQAADDKIFIMADIKEKLKQYDHALVQIITNQNDRKQLLQEIILEERAKIRNIEKQFPSRDMLTEVLNDQKNIKKLLEVNVADHEQTWKRVISNELSALQKTNINRNIQQHLNATVTQDKGENLNLTSNNQSYPTSCADFDANYCGDNKCRIKNPIYGPVPFLVSCNDNEEGGGWTIIQRRINGSVDFDRNWSEYKTGFGDIDGEFFIGLDKLHALTSTLKPVELLIQLEDFNNIRKYAKYDDFQVGNETELYNLIKVGSYVGNVGDSFSQHQGHNFTTKDRNNDKCTKQNCATFYSGAWWYKNCYHSNLNGKYCQDSTKFDDTSVNNCGINWELFRDFKYSLKFAQMLIRPRRL